MAFVAPVGESGLSGHSSFGRVQGHDSRFIDDRPIEYRDGANKTMSHSQCVVEPGQQ